MMQKKLIKFRFFALLLIAIVALFEYGIAKEIPLSSQKALVRESLQEIVQVYPYQEYDWPDNNTRFIEYLEFVENIQKNLQPNCVHRVSFGIILRGLKSDKIALLDRQTFQDLNLFCGQNEKDHYLMNIINQAHTALGFAASSSMLALATSDMETFTKKQNVIRFFLHNSEVYEKLEKELKSFAQVQNALYSSWMHDPLLQTAKSRYYKFSWAVLDEKLNNNSWALNFRQLLDHQKRAFIAAGLVAAGIILPVYGLTKITGSEAILPDQLNKMADRLYSTASPLFGFCQSVLTNSKALGLLAVYSGFISALNAKDSTLWTYDNFKLDQMICSKMAQVSIAISALRNIREIINQHPDLAVNLRYSDKFEDVFSTQASIVVQQFIDIMQNHTQNINQKICNSGKSLAAFKLLSEIKNDLEPALVALGEVDAFVGITRLYKNHQGQENSYCLPEIDQTGSVVLSIENFWNPLVTAKKNITNSIHLGVDQTPTGMIITGPNAGGKSTILRSIATAAIMATAFAIIPASSAKISLFDNILTYLNITDDLAGGNSLFKNQVLRVQKLNRTVQEQSDDQKSLIILDEMFNGTSPQEAQACAFAVAYLLGQKKNVSVLLATHFKNLTFLPTVCSNFANYHVSVQHDVASGAIQYPFLLQLGISEQHIALQILQQEGFDNSIINHAITLLKQTI